MTWKLRQPKYRDSVDEWTIDPGVEFESKEEADRHLLASQPNDWEPFLDQILEHESISALRDQIRRQCATIEESRKHIVTLSEGVNRQDREIRRLEALVADFRGQVAALHAVETGAVS